MAPFKVETIKDPETGTYEQRLLVELPPEEAFESFAARVRPFTISVSPSTGRSCSMPSRV